MVVSVNDSYHDYFVDDYNNACYRPVSNKAFDAVSSAYLKKLNKIMRLMLVIE